MTAYYNEFNPGAVHMLRQLIKDGLIADGDVDERSITEVKADDLKGFTQCHFFAGIGGWSVALRQAGWPDDRHVWTGSCPCQPFSTAGKQKGGADERHLWPVWSKLIAECRPPIVFGEQVSSAVSHGWLDGVYADMEAEGYACGAAVLPACAVDAPHKRDRLWFVADRQNNEFTWGLGTRSGRSGFTDTGGSDGSSNVADATGEQDRGLCKRDTQPHLASSGNMANCHSTGLQGQRRSIGEHGQEGRQEQIGHHTKTGFWHDHDWIICGDGKARRIPSAIPSFHRLANGVFSGTLAEHVHGNDHIQKEEKIDATAPQERAKKELQTLQDAAFQEEVRKWGFGRFFSLYQEKTLQSEMRKQQKECHSGVIPTKGADISQGQMREVQNESQTSNTPHGPRLEKQQSEEFADFMRDLPYEISLGSQWIPLVETGFKHRAPLLHALGNAIVPEVAARFIRAAM